MLPLFSVVTVIGKYAWKTTRCKLLLFSSWGVGRSDLSNCEGPFELYHIEAMEVRQAHSFGTKDSQVIRLYPVIVRKRTPIIRRVFVNNAVNPFTSKEMPYFDLQPIPKRITA